MIPLVALEGTPSHVVPHKLGSIRGVGICFRIGGLEAMHSV